MIHFVLNVVPTKSGWLLRRISEAKAPKFSQALAWRGVWRAVFDLFKVKKSLAKVSFLLVRFLWTSKENEQFYTTTFTLTTTILLSRALVLQSTPQLLLPFNGLEQCLKVSFSKGCRSFSLNDLKEHGGPCLYRFGKNL